MGGVHRHNKGLKNVHNLISQHRNCHDLETYRIVKNLLSLVTHVT